MRTVATTCLALLAFAGNSLLCRAALADHGLDPLLFTAIRLGSGALLLSVWIRPRAIVAVRVSWDWRAATALGVYALAFSLAYRTLATGTGALLLFGAVQVTMLGAGLLRGDRWTVWRVIGFVAALGGVVVQVAPGVSAPDPLGALLMAAAGIAWGVYSLLGRGAADPRAATARNFALCAPVAVAIWLGSGATQASDAEGVWLAVASGAVASALGYVLWYAALRGHSATSAGLVQLTVPLLAAGGGALLLDEWPGGRFVLAAVLVLGGVALAISAPARDRAG